MNNQKQILIYGRLGKNPELKYTRKQEPVCYLVVAEKIEGSDKPEWHKVVVWGKQAEVCQVFLKKGGPVFVRGRMNEKVFKNESGEIKKDKELRADMVGFIGF